ncbi:MAG: murein L,D-transpeptidase catalytic domain family protein [Chitinophagaceae bacterium]
MIYKTLLIVFLTITAIVLPTYFFWYKPKFKVHSADNFANRVKDNKVLFSKLGKKAFLIKDYAKKNGFNENTSFLIDMSIESGKNRFFVYDLKKDSILLAGLVAHGSCDDGFKTSAEFSNKVNSGCSSLGKFKIGGAYKGSFGTSFKLYGLDSTNNNAYQRFVVLHPYSCVPEQETYPLPICNSRGCPMVSHGFMNQLTPIIKASKRPILLFIFQ